jgi:hypothetical protein
VIVFASIAYAAQPLPPWPEPSASVANECTQAIGLEHDAVLPDTLARQGRAQCAGTVVPVSDVVDLLAVESWAVACREQYDIVTVGLTNDLVNVTTERDAALAVGEELQRRAQQQERWLRRPATNLVIGALGATVLIGGGVATTVYLTN